MKKSTRQSSTPPQHVVHHGVAHGIDAVVVPVRHLVHPRAVAVALELLQPELLVGERAPHRVYHDLAHPRQQLVREPPHVTLPGGTHPQPQLATPHRHRLLTVRRVVRPYQLVVLVGIPAGLVRVRQCLGHHGPGLGRRLPVGRQLLEQEHPPLPGHPPAPYEAPRVREPPTVHAVPRAREAAALRVGEPSAHHVTEHGAAGARHLVQVLAPPRALVHIPQVLGLLHEGRAQPLRVRPRHVQVARAPHERVRSPLALQLLAVHPAPQRPRRVVDIEDPEVVPAAPERVQYRADRVDPVELV